MLHLRRTFLPLLALGALAVTAAPAAAQTAASSPSAAVESGAVSPSAQGPLHRVTAKSLKVGATGTNVRRLQALLTAVGLPTEINGEYGSETARSVQRFQFVSGLQTSGLSGPITLRALHAAASAAHSAGSRGGLRFGQSVVAPKRLGSRIPVVRGMSGQDVLRLQDYLRRVRVKGAPRPDGEFGSRTLAAVRRFERTTKRPVDGRMDAGDLFRLLTEVGGDAAPGDLGDPGDAELPAPQLAPGDKAKLGSNGLAIAPEDAPEEVKQVIAAGNKIAKKPYKWGGGHGRWEDSGYDCSGSVSYALRGGGLLKSPLPSYGFFKWGDSGKGTWITLYTNSGHMYMVVAGLRFDTSGRGAKGSRWQKAMRDPSSFRVRHPAGF